MLRTAPQHLIPQHLLSTTPVTRPIDAETGETITDTLADLNAWTPRQGDVAAATYAKENGSYVG